MANLLISNSAHYIAYVWLHTCRALKFWLHTYLSFSSIFSINVFSVFTSLLHFFLTMSYWPWCICVVSSSVLDVDKSIIEKPSIRWIPCIQTQYSLAFSLLFARQCNEIHTRGSFNGFGCHYSWSAVFSLHTLESILDLRWWHHRCK